MSNQWEVIVERDVLAGEDYLLVQHKDRTGQCSAVAPFRLVPRQHGEATEPTLHGESTDIREVLQAFLDAAWSRGLRPRDFEGPQELKAVTSHLDDMRAIAFSFLDIAKK